MHSYKFKILFIIPCFLLFYSCKKNGTGGKNTVIAMPKHHGKTIPNATVYIKYGATELPGESSGDYDQSQIAVKTGSADAQAKFEGLLKGDYYFFSVGYDSSINAPVKGGGALKITSKSGTQELNLAVTE